MCAAGRSLATFVILSLSLQDIEGLSGVKKLERLQLQQNSIKRICDGFKQLIKLREVRLDRNKLSAVENLGRCSALRVVDLSYNQISSVEGLSGLQNLVELKINNNAVRSLRPLKGLPSLKEIDCSYNNLKSLDGIQFLSVVEVVRAEHNQVFTLQLGGDSDGTTEKAMKRFMSSEGSAQSTHANRLSEMTSALKESRKGSSNISVNSGKTKGSKAKAAEEKHLNVIELHLRGNRLKSLENLVPLGPNIEVLDVSNNDLSANDSLLTKQIGHLMKLLEIRIEGNPALLSTSADDSSVYCELQNSIILACPSLQHVDTCAVVGGRVVSTQSSFGELSSKENEASLRLIKNIETKLNIEQQDSPGSQSVLNPDGTISHTWINKGENSTVLGDNETVQNEDSNSSSDDEGAKEEESNTQIKSGLCIDDSMLSEEEIAQIESSFTNLLLECRGRLAALPRPPTKGEDDDGIEIDYGQLSSVYTDLGGRTTSQQPLVTDLGRRTSKNLAAHGEEASSMRAELLSPPMPPNPTNPLVQSIKRQVESENFGHSLDNTTKKSVMTTASSLVTNVIMQTSPATTAEVPAHVKRSSSLKDVNVEAFSRKEGIADV